MKKVLSLLSVFLLLFSLNVSVFAVSGSYDLDELELQVTIPNDYSVITRDTSASDPIFSYLGTTKSAVMSQFESSNIYLNAISDTYNEEVVVTMMENSLTNFSLLSDTTLNTLASTLVNQYTYYGINVSRYDIYQHSQAKFVRLYFTDTDKTVHGLQYYTIYDGNAMNFTMRSYEGSLSSRQEMAIKTIVDSIKYDKAPPVADQGEDTNSFVHTDTDSGVTFTVPANWKQEAFSKDREFIDVKFVSTKEDGCTMIYGSTDMWSQMPASDKVGYTRSDLGNSAFTKSDIAEMCGTTADKISTVTYNGVEYFKGETNYTSDAYGVDITMKMTLLVYIDNGWMYMFQFGGTSTHELYSDFESLLKSVQYPNLSDDTEEINDSINSFSYSNNDSRRDIYYSDKLFYYSVFLVIFILAVIIRYKVKGRSRVHKAIKKDEQNRIENITCGESNFMDNNTGDFNVSIDDAPELPIKTEPVVYCTKCGQALPLDSDFCHKCGTKVFKEDNTQ